MGGSRIGALVGAMDVVSTPRPFTTLSRGPSGYGIVGMELFLVFYRVEASDSLGVDVAKHNGCTPHKLDLACVGWARLTRSAPQRVNPLMGEHLGEPVLVLPLE